MLYEELIKELRDYAAARKGEIAVLTDKAADAIENLIATVGTAYNEMANMAAEQRWIPVTERLPDGIALAVNALRGSYGYKEYLIGCISEDCESDSGYSCESAGETLLNVTHWMPLPEPPMSERMDGDGE